MVKNTKKAQGLPMNTIVIAILVIIVLLVIVVYFISQMNRQGEELENKDPTQCSLNNPVLSSYKNVGEFDSENYDTCEEQYGEGYSKHLGVRNCCYIKE